MGPQYTCTDMTHTAVIFYPLNYRIFHIFLVLFSVLKIYIAEKYRSMNPTNTVVN